MTVLSLLLVVPFVLSAINDAISARIIQAAVKGLIILSMLGVMFIGWPLIIIVGLRALSVLALIAFAVKDVITLKIFHAVSNVILALLLIVSTAPLIIGFIIHAV